MPPHSLPIPHQPPEKFPTFPRGPSLVLALGVAHPSAPAPALPGVPGCGGAAQGVSEPLPQTHRSCRAVPSTEGHISPHTQRETKPCLIFPALANGKIFFFSPFFFIISLTTALFQVFSPQPVGRAPGAPGPGAEPAAPRPLPIAAVPRAVGRHPRDTFTLTGPPKAAVPPPPCRERRSLPLLRLLPSFRLLSPFPCDFAWLRASHAEAPGRGQRHRRPGPPRLPR